MKIITKLKRAVTSIRVNESVRKSSNIEDICFETLRLRIIRFYFEKVETFVGAIKKIEKFAETALNKIWFYKLFRQP